MIPAVALFFLSPLIAAFLAPRRMTPSTSAGPWILGVLTLVAGTVFMAGMRLPTVAAVSTMAAAFAVVAFALLRCPVWKAALRGASPEPAGSVGRGR